MIDNTGSNTKGKELEKDEEMVVESSEQLEIVKSFDDMGLREELLRGMLNIAKTLFE